MGILRGIANYVRTRMAPEMGAAIKSRAVLGSYEMGGLWTGNAYRGDLGLLTSGGPAPSQPQADPLGKARAQAREQPQGPGKERGMQMG